MLAMRLLSEGGPETGGMSWLVWVALAIFFVMVFLGWWVAKNGLLKKEEEPSQGGHESHDAHADHAAPVAETKHEAPVAVVNAVAAPDDLTSLEGIGPKVAQVLAGVGITTFAGLAATEVSKVQEALNAAGYKYMDPAGWIDQAKLAASGDQAGLEKLQSELKGGRRK